MKFIVEKKDALAYKVPVIVPMFIDFDFKKPLGMCKIFLEDGVLFAETDIDIPNGYPALGILETIKCVGICHFPNQDNTIKRVNEQNKQKETLSDYISRVKPTSFFNNGIEQTIKEWFELHKEKCNCPYCGYPNSSDMCLHCGEKLENGEMPVISERLAFFYETCSVSFVRTIQMWLFPRAYRKHCARKYRRYLNDKDVLQ